MTIDRSQDNLLRYPEVRARTSLARSTIEKRVKAGTFPAPIQISAGLVAFYESDINEWIANPMGWRAAA
ncbi:AlpA family transcriptional regulator [Novosphingobium barchaimii LL02]|uniref:AlpA family transcriptional regulator n=1 Tax=Novosphingobium barchaimii LL02 TaxID=1114963 RepID=A0A0J8AF63_9SPHN|nr:AlpA family phage regulatory protein [Novosphingobium barchaimii]KMS53530.1 AlpA family transcriptional regulator [Novosphingobium barchaimii LL02]